MAHPFSLSILRRKVMSYILNPQQISLCAKISAYWRHESFKTKMLYLVVALASSLLMLIISVDYAGLASIFSYLNQGGNANEKVFDEALLCFMGLIFLAGYHWLDKEYGHTPPFRVITASLILFVVAYLLGMGGLFAIIILNSGLDSLFNMTEKVDLASWGEAVTASAAQTESAWQESFLRFIIENGKLLLIAGFSGFALVSCVIASNLWDVIERNYKLLMEKGCKGKEGKLVIADILETEQQHTDLTGQLGAVNDEIGTLKNRFLSRLCAQADGQKTGLEALIVEIEALPVIEGDAGQILQTQHEQDLRQIDIGFLKVQIGKLDHMINGGIKAALDGATHLAIAVMLCLPLIGHTEPLAIGLDLSSSSPLVKSKEFAELAAAAMAEKINAMPMGSRVSIRTFGNGGLENIRKKEAVLSPRNRPSEVAKAVARLIATAKDAATAQGSTYLLSFLMQTDFHCDEQGEVIVITDGLEGSADLMMTDKMLNKSFTIPEPQKGLLKDCRVLFWGLGRTADGVLSAKQVRNLDTAWNDWFKAAGAEFKSISNP
jgi:hypothetical protein